MESKFRDFIESYIYLQGSKIVKAMAFVSAYLLVTILAYGLYVSCNVHFFLCNVFRENYCQIALPLALVATVVPLNV